MSRSSLYFRLLLVYGLTFLLIAMGLGYAFRTTQTMDVRKLFVSNLELYGNYIARDIGTPPRLDRAKELHEQTGLDIAIHGPGTDWSTNAKEFETANSDQETGWKRRWKTRPHRLQVTQGGYTFSFSNRNWHDPANAPSAFALALALAAFVLILSYLMIRWIFRPLHWIREGALAFGEGQWEHRIPLKGVSELNDLSVSMNSMAGRIQAQFKSMRDLLVAISHEFRSPLTRMRVALEFVPDPSLRESLSEEILLLDRMTESLLERERLNSRPESLKRESVDLTELTERVARPFRDRAPGLDAQVPTTPVQASVDSARFSIALRNLLENALKHAGNTHKKIELRFEVAPIQVGSTGNNPNEVRISVQDFGGGIPDDVLKRLGEPFFRPEAARTGSRDQGGFGLGLSLTYSIIEAHGGRIEASSREGYGTRFTIVLPLS